MITDFKVAVCLAFFVHFVLLYSIFDVYYKSPIVHGMVPHGNSSNAPAARLVLIVADGLRAQTFFDQKTKAPFLKKVMHDFGSWGVSHTRVPTESRPGHVALAAGFYEDVSAITKGWRENPVEFDSVFNQSTFTWSWGSPDILPMFAKGASGDHVFTSTYPNHFEDFADSDPSKLDTWVFDNVQTFFADAERNSTLNEMVRRNKVIFFLHLLGTDTIGHGFKPKSKEYVENVAAVDVGVKNLSKLIERFFDNDGKTAFVFTSDHGMTDWGSHGAGDEHETQTPFVAWGAGVKRFPSTKHRNVELDLNQIDMAPLMAALIGVDMPLNSIGILPVRYLNATDQYKALAACANFDAVVEQMLIQRKIKYDTSFRFLFREFSSLSLTKLNQIQRQIAKLIQQRRYTLASNVCSEWIATTIDGLIYYYRYERTFLTFFVVLTFVSWQLLVWTLIAADPSPTPDDEIFNFSAVSLRKHRNFILIVSILFLYLWSTSQPLTYYVYCALPLILLYLSRKSLPFCGGKTSIRIFPRNCSDFIRTLVFCLAVEILVVSFFRRWALSIGLLLFAVWPHFQAPHLDRKTKAAWIVACLVNSLFPLLPTVGQSVSYGVVSASCLLVGFVGYASTTWRNIRTNGAEFRKLVLFNLSSVILLCCSFVVVLTAESVEAKRGSPLLSRLVGWSVLVSSPLLPMLADRSVTFRCATIFLSFFAPFALMSVSYEPYFLICFSILLFLWLKVEHGVDAANCFFDVEYEFGATDEDNNLGARPPSVAQVQVRDLRRAYFFVFFILLAFFGTGNVASMNSFNPSFIYCFVTVFSPFLMATLLLVKIVIPFLFVCTAVYAVETVGACGCAGGRLFWLIVIISDFMALNFFFLLKDSGSWLDIGSSISHFVISMAITIVTMLLYGAAKFLTTAELVDVKRHVL